MRYTRAGDADRPALRALWQQAFCDDEQTIDAFFKTLFPVSDAFAAREGDALCAMLFCLPQTLVCAEGEQKAAYVYAVATDERYRRQGACRGLLQYAEKKLKSRGVRLMLLSAATEALGVMYEKLGFSGGRVAYAPQALPLPAGRAEVVTATAYAGLRETLLWDVPHVRYSLPELRLQTAEGGFYALTLDGRYGCAAVRMCAGVRP